MVLTEATTFITGTQSTVYTLFAPTQGKVTVSLADFALAGKTRESEFRARRCRPACSLQLSGPGTLEFELSSAGNVLRHSVGHRAGRMGCRSLFAACRTLACRPPVPLPPALGLLLMGLASTFGC